jgi:hypothetical protein
MFTGMFILFKSKEYIKFYTKFMIDNNLFFPRYMSWYSFNIENEHKKYIQYLKDNINMGDDEIQELLAYCNDKQISIKDICYNINTINEGEILNGS